MRFEKLFTKKIEFSFYIDTDGAFALVYHTFYF